MLRRTFLISASAGCATAASTPAQDPGSQAPAHPKRRPEIDPATTFDPWIDVDLGAMTANVRALSKLAQGKPLLAVIKNNAYGSGLVGSALHLESLAEVWGIAVANVAEGVAVREAGVRKPIVVLGPVSEAQLDIVVRLSLMPSLYLDYGKQLEQLARKYGRPVKIQFYLDSGLGRVGVPHHRALPLLESLAAREGVQIAGLITGLSEHADFDKEQADRIRAFVAAAKARNVNVGPVHAAASGGVFHTPFAHFDMIRPGIAVFGCYPDRESRESGVVTLQPTASLRSRVIYVKQLRTGDSVQYGRAYVAKKPTWVATLSVGHTDGWPPGAVGKSEVIIGERRYPIIGMVSGNHTLVEVGERQTVDVGDTATFIGTAGRHTITPETVAEQTGKGIYKLIWHLGRHLPRRYMGA